MAGQVGNNPAPSTLLAKLPLQPGGSRQSNTSGNKTKCADSIVDKEGGALRMGTLGRAKATNPSDHAMNASRIFTAYRRRELGYRCNQSEVLAILWIAVVFLTGCSSWNGGSTLALEVNRKRIANTHLELVVENTNTRPVVLSSQYILIDYADGRNFVVMDDRLSGSVLLRSGASQILYINNILEGGFLFVYKTKPATRRQEAIIESLDHHDFKKYQNLLSKTETIENDWICHTSNIQSYSNSVQRKQTVSVTRSASG
jgi:hypothetical protein